jgi:hypothetical protein
MGFIKSSTTIQLYAYFTEYARERIFNGDVIDFQIKNFSLHDEDINYKISKESIGVDSSGNTLYNTPKSGFIPDITGDNDVCIKSNKSTIILGKNMLTVSTPVVFGCTNQLAANYNPLANVDDGSCIIPPTLITAEYIVNCLTDNSGNVNIRILGPNGGSGGPYTWKALPVDSLGNQVNLPNPTYYQYRQSTDNFDYPTVFNGNNVYYKIYVKDSEGNENIIHTTTNVCQTTPVSLILKVDPPTVSLFAVGSFTFGNTTISQTPSQNFNFVATLTKSNGGVISQAERNVSFKIKKDLNFDNNVDITTSAGASFPTNTFNFTSGIPNASNTEIRLTIPLKVDRTSVGTQPVGFGATPAIQAMGGYVQAINGIGIEVTMINIVGNVETQSNTLTIRGNKWVWT